METWYLIEVLSQISGEEVDTVLRKLAYYMDKNKVDISFKPHKAKTNSRVNLPNES